MIPAPATSRFETVLIRASGGLDLWTEAATLFSRINPNQEVGAIHPKAMPVILRTEEEWETRMSAPWAEAASLQRPLRNGALRIVAHGALEDAAA